MAVPSNTLLTYDTVGIREELEDVIYLISPDETPFMSSIGRDDADNTLFEWEIDSLAAANPDNANLEGDTATTDASVQPVRIGNYTEIADKVARVSGTTEATERAGRGSEMERELAKKSREMKIDMEASALANRGAFTGSLVAARRTGSFLAFIKSNTDFGAGGSDPVYTNIPTDPRNDGTLRTFTGAQVKTVQQEAYANGGKPTMLLVGVALKAATSSTTNFPSIAERNLQLNGPEVTATISAIDFYVTDFGSLRIVPDLFMRVRDALLVDPAMASFKYLRPFFTQELSKDGDSNREQMLVEWGLKVHNEKAHGIVADVQP